MITEHITEFIFTTASYLPHKPMICWEIDLIVIACQSSKLHIAN